MRYATAAHLIPTDANPNPSSSPHSNPSCNVSRGTQGDLYSVVWVLHFLNPPIFFLLARNLIWRSQDEIEGQKSIDDSLNLAAPIDEPVL